MYPKDILPGIDLYVIMLCVAVLSAIFVFRYVADKKGLNSRLFNLCLYNAIGSVVAGYFSAVLFQAVYNIPKYGAFKIGADTGATFYGGLIGGAAFFLAVYFVAGKYMFGESREHVKQFRNITDFAAPCIAIAHGFGRIGCLMAGCCHGAVTDKWYGIYMSAVGAKVVPIQLYEAIVLFALFGAFMYRVLKGKTYNLPLYMAVYGAWRFVIEYARDDYRGYTFVEFLSPSQLTAVLMILGAAVVFWFEYRSVKKCEAVQDCDEV